MFNFRLCCGIQFPVQHQWLIARANTSQKQIYQYLKNDDEPIEIADASKILVDFVESCDLWN